MLSPFPSHGPPSSNITSSIMGALAETPHPALRIQHALDELTSGNSLEYLRLQHTLRGTNPSTLAPILAGLTHFAIKLHHDAPQKPLHTLFNVALQIDLPTVAGSVQTLNVTFAFLRNLISADVSFVEPVLRLITRCLLLSVEGRDGLMKAVEGLIEFLLCTHQRAGALVVQILREGYPHAVRPVEEHVPYMRGILCLTRRNKMISRALTNLVYERMVGVEALVPQVADGGNECVKMEKYLEEVFYHFDSANGKTFGRVFEEAFEAYESYVVPCESRFSAYCILYGAEKGGIVYQAVERLRVRFFERGTVGLREKFLEHSCGMLIRAKNIDKQDVITWMRQLSTWLNNYIDNCIRRGVQHEVDVDLHGLFYCACAAFVIVLVERSDCCDEFIIGDMRVGRIVGCGMRPLVMLDGGLVDRFLEVVGADIFVGVENGYRPSRTRFGAKNTFEFRERLPQLSLPSARQLVKGVVRSC